MKPIIRFILAGVPVLLVLTVAPAYARQEQHQQEANPPKQEHQAPPEKQRRTNDKQQQNQNKQQQQRAQQQQQNQNSAAATGPATAAEPEQTAAATVSATGESVVTARATRAAWRTAGGVAAAACAQLGLRAPHLAAAWRLQRLSHSTGSLSALLWSATQVPHLQVPYGPDRRVSPFPVRRLLVQSG